MSSLFLLISIILLTLASGWCSASEAALFSLSSIKIKSFKNSSNYRECLIAKLLTQPRNLLVTIFLLNTLVNILLQNVVSHVFMNTGGWIVAIGLPFILLLIFGEIVPKYIGIQNNLNFSKKVAPSLAFLEHILTPIRKFILYLVTPITRIFSLFLKKDAEISQEELSHVLRKSTEANLINQEAAELIWGYVNLQDSTVREIMRPRTDILYYEIHEPLSKLIHLFVNKQCSRIPVCEKDVENPIGIIDAKHFFIQRDHIHQPDDLKQFMRRPYFIPEAMSAHALLRRLDENGEEIAIVVDEYGSISGLVAYEDLVEVVVGKISDSRDQKVIFTRAGKNEMIASGKMELDEFNQLFDSNLTSDNSITLGGWLTEQLGDIPKSGTKFENQFFLFQVLSADPNRIRRIYVRKLNQEPQ